MITLLAATAFLTGGAFAPTTVTSTAGTAATLEVAKAVVWDDVADYIAVHATVRNAIAEALLHVEATAGIKTWTYAVATSGNYGFSKLDGPGLGWPAINRVVRFSTAAQANTAIDLMDQLTASSSIRSFKN